MHRNVFRRRIPTIRLPLQNLRSRLQVRLQRKIGDDAEHLQQPQGNRQSQGHYDRRHPQFPSAVSTVHAVQLKHDLAAAIRELVTDAV